MIRISGHIVFHHRCAPDGCEPHFLNIIELVDNSPNISAMSSAGACSVYLAFFHSRNHIIGGIAIGKTVGHNQVNNVGSRKTLQLIGILLACQ